MLQHLTPEETIMITMVLSCLIPMQNRQHFLNFTNISDILELHQDRKQTNIEIKLL